MSMKTYIAQQIRLHYYNDYLFGNGMITGQERSKLKFKIDSRKLICIKKEDSSILCAT